MQRKNSGRTHHRAARNENRGASATKKGPGRFAVHGKPGNRIAKAREIRAYVALGAAWAAKRITKAKLRDGHGAYTLVGRGEMPNGITDGRRIWLGGISAQRGY
jgi:hypothetical protein